LRRAAIGLDLLGVEFEHQAVSVFNHFTRFQELNPIVKAPTLVFDDGTFLMDSSLILEFFESQSATTLWAAGAGDRLLEARVVSLALAACEKSVQAVYELNLRPEEQHHRPWLDRIAGQRSAAFDALESEIGRHPATFAATSHASIAAAIAFQFATSERPDLVEPSRLPELARHSQRMEALSIFQKYPPVGPGVQASELPA
jgi:glutathione S-transferase